MIQSKDITIGYSSKKIGPINHELKEGALQILIGKNGAGKSTFLKSILGILPVIGGEIRLDNKKIVDLSATERADQIAYVASVNPHISHITVTDLLNINPSNKAITGEHLKPIAKQLGIEHLLNKYLDELSDGELQKAYIARAFAQNTKYILLDEPASHLDIKAKLEIFLILKELAHHHNKGILCSSHDLELAVKIADQLVLLRDDEIISGAPEDLILNGSIAKAFNSEKIGFNKKTGSFDLCLKHHKTITFKADGNEAYWLEKALNRVGFNAKMEIHNPDITVDNGYHYHGYHFTSIGELLTLIKANG